MYKRRGNSDTVKVPLHEQVRQFPDENFIVREGKLFCNACREILSTKKSILKILVSSSKQNCASLGYVYPAHGSASNMTVKWLLAAKVLILTPSFINKQLLSITCC